MIITDTLSHLLALVLDSERENPLFRAPIEKDPKHILDIGTGKGNWAMYVKREKPPPSSTRLTPIYRLYSDVADMFPSSECQSPKLSKTVS